MPEIQRVSIRHEAILDYLMSYPRVPLGTVAVEFGVSQPWLSCIIHSDAFQALLREKQGVAFHSTVLPIREKMLAVAHAALDELGEAIPLESDTKVLSQVAADVLDRLGYTAKVPAQVNTQNNVIVLRSELEDARKLLGAAVRPALEDQNGHEDLRTEAPLQGESEPLLGPALPFDPFSAIQRELSANEARAAVRAEGSRETGEEV